MGSLSARSSASWMSSSWAVAELGERGLSYKTILRLTDAYGATLVDLAREIER
jgi:hypothetical protein